MGAFLEQYGIAIFVLVIVGIMVLMSSSMGHTIEGLVTQEVKRFTDKAISENTKAVNGEYNKGEVGKEEDKNTTLNEYGFYYNRVYKQTPEDTPYSIHVVFTKSKMAHVWIQLDKEYYNENKSEFGGYSYEDANSMINTSMGLNSDGLKTTTVYEQSKATIDFDGGMSLFFSNDGTKGYFTEDKTSDYLELTNDSYTWVESEPTNEYGFFYGTYVGNARGTGWVDTKTFITLAEDGTVKMWEELGEEDYYNHKEDIDGDLSTNNYEDAKARWNYFLGTYDGMITDNTTYEKSHVFVDYEHYNGSVTFKYELNFYFSSNGKILYFDEARTTPMARLQK